MTEHPVRQPEGSQGQSSQDSSWPAMAQLLPEELRTTGGNWLGRLQTMWERAKRKQQADRKWECNPTCRMQSVTGMRSLHLLLGLLGHWGHHPLVVGCEARQPKQLHLVRNR